MAVQKGLIQLTSISHPKHGKHKVEVRHAAIGQNAGQHDSHEGCQPNIPEQADGQESHQITQKSNQQSQGSSQSNTDPAYNEYNNYTSKNEYNSYTNNNEYNSYTRNNSSSSNKTGGYIISYSSDVLLTSSDIQGLSKQQLRYARNEIYARHGRKFQSQDLRNYFNSKSWYRGVIEPSNFNDKTMLTNIEIKNIQFLKSVEDSM